MQTLLNVRDAAARIGLSVSTLNKYRCSGDGPRYVRLGKRRVAYPVAELDAWVAARVHGSTSEYGMRR